MDSNLAHISLGDVVNIELALTKRNGFSIIPNLLGKTRGCHKRLETLIYFKSVFCCPLSVKRKINNFN
ncbi:hypothetical protein [Lysinibacillus cavernae]|uniref:hypothetical protein n=1 Tax=Lysinibacillus cavernae TaxID=2666135 RepID=UPI0012D9D598|nr:hypothetical protein [Lysinibacillus cavernae]